MTYRIGRAVTAGFTMLELLVVLALVGLAAGIALPALQTQYERWVSQTQIDDAMNAVAYWPVQAKTKRQEIFLPATEQALTATQLAEFGLALPEGWSVRVLSGLRLLPSGVCMGGEVELSTAQTSFQLSLMPPFCSPSEPRAVQ